MRRARRAVVLLALCTMAAAGCQRRRAPGPERQAPSLLGDELGIDHVGVAAKDLQAAAATYQGRLGFERPISGRLPNGIDNVNFYFEDATYLELLTARNRQKVPWLAWFIDHHTEGGNFVVLSTSSVTGTAAFLKGRGLEMSPPSPGRIEIEGGRPGGSWRTLYFERSPLPGSPLYFIEYPQPARADFLHKLQDPEVRRRSFVHRNTAVGIRAVWMAVPDLAAATRAYVSIGLRAEAAAESEALDARTQMIGAGRGHLILFSPRGAGGPVKEFLDRRGPGVLGLAVEVRSIETARQVIGGGTGATYDTYAGPLGASILVPPKQAHGTYLELFQPAATD